MSSVDGSDEDQENANAGLGNGGGGGGHVPELPSLPPVGLPPTFPEPPIADFPGFDLPPSMSGGSGPRIFLPPTSEDGDMGGMPPAEPPITTIPTPEPRIPTSQTGPTVELPPRVTLPPFNLPIPALPIPIPFIPTTTTTTAQGASNVTVIVNNAVDIANNGIENVAARIKEGIENGANQAAEIAKNTAETITKTVGNLADSIFSGVKSAIGQIWDWLKEIGSAIEHNLGSLIGFITNNLGKAVTQIANAVTSLIEPLTRVIDKIATTVQDINDRLIQPVTTAIMTSIQTITVLTQVIERDLHSGLSGILAIPKDIADAMTSLDATLNRTIEQLGKANKDVISTTLGGTAEDTIWKRLEHIGAGITKMAGSKPLHTTFQASDHLTEPRIAEAGAKAFDAIWKEIVTFIKDLFSFGQPSIDALKTLPIAIPFLVGETIEFPMLLIALVIAFVEAMEPLLEFIKDDINLKTGLAKLSPADALAAWVRGFIDKKDLDEELGIRGWDASRIKVITDLQHYLIDVQNAMDMYYRGIITEDELRLNMTQHAVTKVDQDAFLQQSVRLIDVATAGRAFLRGFIDMDALDSVLFTHRYTPNEITLYKSLLLSPETPEQLIERHKRNALYSNHLTSDPLFNTLPGDVLEAAHHVGMGAQQAADLWMNQFQVPSITHWIQLFFRNKITHTQLMGVMDYFRVPQEWRQDYIDVSRSLIPWRTIPRMLAAGIIDDQYAKQQLGAHGFDQRSTEVMLKFADSTKTKSATDASGNLHGASVANARQFWQLGAITDEQYEEVLTHHGYDVSMAQLAVQTEKLQSHVHERKQIATDLVNEVLAGLITVDDAQVQMSNQNFSVEERAKVLRQIARVQRATVKTPGEAELRAMVKADVISIDEYRNAMGILGFASTWIDAFVKLHFGGSHAPTVPA